VIQGEKIVQQKLLTGLDELPDAILGFGSDPPFALLRPGFLVDLGRNGSKPRLHPARFYNRQDERYKTSMEEISEQAQSNNSHSTTTVPDPSPPLGESLDNDERRLITEKQDLISQRKILDERYRRLRERATRLVTELRSHRPVTSQEQLLRRIAASLTIPPG
jgi:hypothetical protein